MDDGARPVSRQIHIVGRSCRLPGARGPEQFWRLLEEGRSAVGAIDAGRWDRARYFHPRPGVRGKSYTFAAGTIDDVWHFDAGAFGMSPREAAQLDPQQRLALKLAWEAMEDAGLPPSRLAGARAGVFAGVSSTDFITRRMFDPAAGDAYTMTGGSLALVANRISYFFNLTGPSLAIDTACSSSLVALHQAAEALRSGEIALALVVGVNILLNPLPFIGFSAARMLSPEGRCKAFAADPQGYVRAEGGVALLLIRADSEWAALCSAKARLLATGVNADGRTFGVALPSQRMQARLLRETYLRAGVEPGEVAFVEAHGTGTRAGDAAEAAALGEALASRRARPLPIGSAKANIGHLEPAAGLAGLMKAMMALERGWLPSSLLCDTPNPDIPFDRLNLAVAKGPLRIEAPAGRRYAGVSAFGFGGSNAHAVIADAPADAAPQPRLTAAREPAADILLLSAHDAPALRALAAAYGQRIEMGGNPRAMAAAAAHGREMLAERLAVATESSVWPAALRAAAEGAPHPGVVRAKALEGRPAPFLVFAGNGSQWPGMGLAAYRRNALFRAEFDLIDALFKPLAGWSLAEAIADPALAERLGDTTVAQPLLFATQASLAAALVLCGLRPAGVIGHSVGEIAASHAAGVFTREQAVELIFKRSQSQAPARGLGGMAALALPESEARALIAARRLDGLCVAAVNSPRAVTLSGDEAAIAALLSAAREAGAACVRLDIEYPFHSPFMEAGCAELAASLGGLRPARRAKCAFFSTVAGTQVAPETLDGEYWRRNIRDPVLFQAAVEAARAAGARLFIEIGPRPVLQGYLGACLASDADGARALPSFDRAERDDGDPVRLVLARAIAHGADFDLDRAFGPRPRSFAGLPLYPWQEKACRPEPTRERMPGLDGDADEASSHPLAGAPLALDAPVWRAHLDGEALPLLAEHRVAGAPTLPASAFAEMALAVGRHWLQTDEVEIEGLRIAAPLRFPPDETMEVETRLTPETGAIRVAARPRLSGSSLRDHAFCRVRPSPGRGDEAEEVAPEWTAELTPDPAPAFGDERADIASLYVEASRCGLDYGRSFRLLQAARLAKDGSVELRLAPCDAGAYLLHPAALDACFQALFFLLKDARQERRAYIPTRIGLLRLTRAGARIATARLRPTRIGRRSVEADFALFDDHGRLAARLAGGRFQAADLAHAPRLEEVSWRFDLEPIHAPGGDPSPAGASLERLQAVAADFAQEPSHREARLIAEAAARRIAFDFAHDLSAERPVAAAPPETFARSLASLLAETGWAREEDGAYRLAQDCPLPPADDILRTLIADHPSWSVEAALLNRLRELGALGMMRMQREQLFSAASIAHCRGDSPRMQSVFAAAAFMLRQASGAWPAARPLRVLGLSHAPGSFARRLREALPPAATVCAFDVADAAMTEDLPAFDCVVMAGAIRAFADFPHRLEEFLRRALPTGGFLIGAEPPDDAFDALIFGALGAPQREALWADLIAAGWRESAAADAGSGAARVRFFNSPLRPPQEASDAPPGRTVRILGGASSPFAAALREALAARRICAREAEAPPFAGELVCHAEPSESAGASEIADHICALKASIEAAPSCRIWVVAEGGAADGRNSGAAAIWAAMRAAANEYLDRDIRLADFEAGLTAREKAAALAGWIADPGAETALVLGRGRALAMRARRGLFRPETQTVAHDEQYGTAMEENAGGPGASRPGWRRVRRRAPGPGEAEIAVAASGLNFRDVMWSLGMLPDEALEDGFAGATLGFECAGRVERLGEGVADLQPGDLVVALAPAAFASHVTVARHAMALVPPAVDAVAAATMPVAFLTAHYALNHLARLQQGEWLLIHGGAGGVGLAALQIARAAGARVIATAGSEEKRALLRLLGAELALDSRSLDFAGQALAHAGGVDVVLNSLSGEAMERSLGVLKPFGRFIELGKRDYYADARLSLRPFRRNLSYFGVDADQLMAARPQLARRLMDEIMENVRSGALMPLPYRLFAGEQAADAFRLMQQSGHIGKILIAPAGEPSAEAPEAAAFKPCGQGWHLVIGGLGGFGLAAAERLVRLGARRIVLTGLAARVGAEQAAALARMDALGARIRIERCDAADEPAMAALLSALEKEAPLKGVVHAAMRLDDGALSAMTRERIEAVLRPKVDGAAVIDRLTRSLGLDYFVLFSSVSAFVGNPGQAAYAAANAYLEAMARRRRAEGRPALAIAWGPIVDAGYLARKPELLAVLERRAGTSGLTAAAALDFMCDLLARDGRAPETAVAVVAPMDWAAAAGSLALARGPLFASLVREAGHGARAAGLRTDIVSALDGLSDQEALALVAGRLIEDVAAIFRAPPEAISPSRPLVDLGMDSLMMVELEAAARRSFGVDLPAAASDPELTIDKLARGVLQTLRRRDPAPDDGAAAMDSLARLHGHSPEEAAALSGLARRVPTVRDIMEQAT